MGEGSTGTCSLALLSNQLLQIRLASVKQETSCQPCSLKGTRKGVSTEAERGLDCLRCTCLQVALAKPSSVDGQPLISSVNPDGRCSDVLCNVEVHFTSLMCPHWPKVKLASLYVVSPKPQNPGLTGGCAGRGGVLPEGNPWRG